MKKGGHSNSENQKMYMYHRSNNLNSRQTATTTTAPTATSKWVINMSSTPLTEAQKQVLVRGPNFTIFPRSPPIGEYIAVAEQTCQSLAKGVAEELCAEVKAVIKKIQPPRPNITREEQKALKELSKDITRVVLTADMVHKESRTVIKARNIQDHSCLSNNKAEEQAYITAEEHQCRSWDK